MMDKALESLGVSKCWHCGFEDKPRKVFNKEGRDRSRYQRYKCPNCKSRLSVSPKTIILFPDYIQSITGQGSINIETKYQDPEKPDKLTDLAPNEQGVKVEVDHLKGTAEASLGINSSNDREFKEIVNLETLLSNFEIDTEIWEVAKSVVNTWGIYDRHPRGFRNNIQVKAWLNRKTDIVDWDTFKANLLEDLGKLSPKYPLLEYQNFEKIQLSERNVVEIDPFDIHWGKLGWKEEAGENYDMKIAHERFMTTLQQAIMAASTFKIEAFKFPLGQDFFHTDKDYPFGQTTKGTPQEADGRWQKVFRSGWNMLADAIVWLSQIAPVHVYMIPGNHDMQKSFYLGEVLVAKFANNPNVTIDNSANPRKYWKYGNNLIGYSHGSKDENIQRLPLIMAQNNKQWWADTVFREWHLGEIHHEKTYMVVTDVDENGVVIRHLKSLSGTDAWHNLSGFTGSIKGLQSFVWNWEAGNIAKFDNNVIMR